MTAFEYGLQSEFSGVLPTIELEATIQAQDDDVARTHTHISPLPTPCCTIHCSPPRSSQRRSAASPKPTECLLPYSKSSQSSSTSPLDPISGLGPPVSRCRKSVGSPITISFSILRKGHIFLMAASSELQNVGLGDWVSPSEDGWAATRG
jgi:hypothetical protein